MSQTIHQAAFELLMYDIRRSEAVTLLMHQFGVSKAIANAAITKTQNSMLGK